MDFLNDLRNIVEEYITKTDNDKYKIIKEILSDDECFFKIGIDVAIDILDSLNVENIFETYTNLIDSENYLESTSLKIID